MTAMDVIQFFVIPSEAEGSPCQITS